LPAPVRAALIVTSMADDELIDASGTVHERNLAGQYAPSTGAFGNRKDVDAFGQPNVERDIFGNPRVKRDFWGEEVRSEDGGRLYVGSGRRAGSGTMEELAGTWMGILLLIGLAILVGVLVVSFLAARLVIRFAGERLMRLALTGRWRLGALLPPDRDLLPKHGAIADAYVNCASALTLVVAPALIVLLAVLGAVASGGQAVGFVIPAIVAGLVLALALGTASTLPVARLGHLGGVLGALGLVVVTVLAVAAIATLASAIPPPPQTAAQAAGSDSTVPNSVVAPATPAASATPDVQAIQSALSTYFNAVNNRDYDTAWAQYTPQEQARIGSEQQYIQGEETTHVSNMALTGVVSRSPGVAQVTYTFTSTQDASKSPDGQPCDSWTLVYTMVSTGSAWLIDNAVGDNGVAYRPC
jgi:hypothetical protein